MFCFVISFQIAPVADANEPDGSFLLGLLNRVNAVDTSSMGAVMNFLQAEAATNTTRVLEVVNSFLQSEDSSLSAIGAADIDTAVDFLQKVGYNIYLRYLFAIFIFDICFCIFIFFVTGQPGRR